MCVVCAVNADSIRVMSFNIRYASAGDGVDAWENADQLPDRRDVVIGLITDKQPHIVGFQEAQNNQITDLHNMLPNYYALESQGISGGQREYAAFAYDTNVLSLLDSGVFSLGNSPGGSYWNNAPGVPFDPYDYFPDMGLAFPRIAMWGRFFWKSTGQEFMFYTTHFDFNNTPQRNSSSLIIDDSKVRNDRMPLSPLSIVVGDFNSSQNNDDWKIFTGSLTNNGVTGDFTDAWWTVHNSWSDAGTFHGFAGGTQPPDKRIDWVLSRGGFLAESMEIVNTYAMSTNIPSGNTHNLYPSDHYPVMATLSFPSLLEDYDRDGLPDVLEMASSISLATDANTDDDGLLDGEEDLNGDGVVDGGETDPANGTDNYRPTDIRNYYMDGVLDYQATVVGSHGLTLYWRFDGRYLYVAMSDAGEGSDHFIFIATNPAVSVSAPWGKTGLVGQYAAFLADENDNTFAGWFDYNGADILDPTARAATYFENGGRLEGVIDLSILFGAGFTNIFYLSAAPWLTADGGSLVESAQVPATVVFDGNMQGTNEYIRIDPGDIDGDGVNDTADSDRDGDGLADSWERIYGFSTSSTNGVDGANGDPDDDGATNEDELVAGTSPSDNKDVFRILSLVLSNEQSVISWQALYNVAYVVETTHDLGSSAEITWSPFSTNMGTIFPVSTNTAMFGAANNSFIRVRRGL